MKRARTSLPATLAAFAAPLFAGAAFGYEALQPIDRNPSFLEAKITAVINAVGEGINKQDFSKFRESYVVSSQVTKRISEKDLHDAFKPLIDGKVDLTRLNNIKPIMDGPPQEDADHQLLVSGHYPTSPPLNFRMGFIREGSHLGLSTIDFSAGPSDSPAQSTSAPSVPGGHSTETARPIERARPDNMIDADLMAALVANSPMPRGISLPADQRAALTAAVHAFTLGVTSRDMNTFLKQDIVSPRWREAQTGDKLAVLYRTTIERGADFAKFDGADIVVPHVPALAPTGELSIDGMIVAKDQERIAFRAGFEREGGTLKLINLLVARSRPRVQ